MRTARRFTIALGSLSRLLADERGSSHVEHALLLGLMVIGVASAAAAFGAPLAQFLLGTGEALGPNATRG